MKRSISLILAALLLASSMTACGDTSKEHETKAETNAPVWETADTAETEAPAPSYDTSLLTENGIAKAHIVLSADAGETLRYAAEELVYHIKKVTGADITVSETVQENSLPIPRRFLHKGESDRIPLPCRSLCRFCFRRRTELFCIPRRRRTGSSPRSAP
jgi:hypothetical protein